MNSNTLKNIFKNLSLSTLIIILLFYITIIIFGNLNAIYSSYFYILIVAIFVSISIFIPFIIRWIYTKDFYLKKIIIPSFIAIITFLLIVNWGFNINHTWEKKYLNRLDIELEKYNNFTLLDDFKKNFINKQSSKIFGQTDFIPNNVTQVEEGVFLYNENIKLTSQGAFFNELFYNDFILDKNEPIIQEYLKMLEEKDKNIKNIINTNNKYNFSNGYQVYFNHYKTQKLLHDKLLGIFKIRQEKKNLAFYTSLILKSFENNSIDGYKLLERRKEFYDNNIDKFTNSSKYCDGLYLLKSNNIIFLNEIPDCFRYKINFTENTTSSLFSLRAPRFSINVICDDNKFTLNPTKLISRIRCKSNIFFLEVPNLGTYSDWLSAYQDDFNQAVEEIN